MPVHKFVFDDGVVEYSPVDMGSIRLSVIDEYDAARPKPKPPNVKLKSSIDANWVILSMELYGKPRDRRAYNQAVENTKESPDYTDEGYIESLNEWEIRRTLFEYYKIVLYSVVGQDDLAHKIVSDGELLSRFCYEVRLNSELGGDAVWRNVRKSGRAYRGVPFMDEYQKRAKGDGNTDTWEGIATDLAITYNVYEMYKSSSVAEKASITADLLMKSCMEGWSREDMAKNGDSR